MISSFQTEIPVQHWQKTNEQIIGKFDLSSKLLRGTIGSIFEREESSSGNSRNESTLSSRKMRKISRRINMYEPVIF